MGSIILTFLFPPSSMYGIYNLNLTFSCYMAALGTIPHNSKIMASYRKVEIWISILNDFGNLWDIYLNARNLNG